VIGTCTAVEMHTCSRPRQQTELHRIRHPCNAELGRL